MTSISIIKPKILQQNGTGSGFRRKIGRDGGIEKKKGGKAGFENPYCGPSFYVSPIQLKLISYGRTLPTMKLVQY